MASQAPEFERRHCLGGDPRVQRGSYSRGDAGKRPRPELSRPRDHRRRRWIARRNRRDRPSPCRGGPPGAARLDRQWRRRPCPQRRNPGGPRRVRRPRRCGRPVAPGQACAADGGDAGRRPRDGLRLYLLRPHRRRRADPPPRSDLAVRRGGLPAPPRAQLRRQRQLAAGSAGRVGGRRRLRARPEAPGRGGRRGLPAPVADRPLLDRRPRAAIPDRLPGYAGSDVDRRRPLGAVPPADARARAQAVSRSARRCCRPGGGRAVGAPGDDPVSGLEGARWRGTRPPSGAAAFSWGQPLRSAACRIAEGAAETADARRTSDPAAGGWAETAFPRMRSCGHAGPTAAPPQCLGSAPCGSGGGVRRAPAAMRIPRGRRPHVRPRRSRGLVTSRRGGRRRDRRPPLPAEPSSIPASPARSAGAPVFRLGNVPPRPASASRRRPRSRRCPRASASDRPPS